MNNEVKYLNKAYTKKFKHLNKQLLNTRNSGLLIFVEHLKYLRDIQVLTTNSIETNSYIASLNAAIEEFEAYTKNQKEFHWNNFCEFVKLNMKEWLSANDSV
jgi:hypothetical protein